MAAHVAPTHGAAVALNPIGALQELAQKQRLRSPAYVVEQLSEAPPLFRATVTVAGPTAGTFTAEASTKQEAKKRAAGRALKS